MKHEVTSGMAAAVAILHSLLLLFPAYNLMIQFSDMHRTTADISPQGIPHYVSFIIGNKLPALHAIPETSAPPLLIRWNRKHSLPSPKSTYYLSLSVSLIRQKKTCNELNKKGTEEKKS
jgi:hypothetical protein